MVALFEEANAVLERLGFSKSKKDIGNGVRIQAHCDVERKHPKITLSVQYQSPDKDDYRVHTLYGPNDIDLTRPESVWGPALELRCQRLLKKAQEHLEDGKCPHCGGMMVQRKVKREGDLQGKTFLGCVNFPKCRGMKADWKETVAADDGKWLDDVLCPECGSQLAIRYAKRGQHKGKRFYGCTAYPNCNRIVEKDEFVALRLMSKENQRPDPIEVDSNSDWNQITPL
ncbi:MAG: topoisomerase DNA-binding C4 zinc finger domain-containing protein [Planctomycetota bacterium]|jgi:ssDNA-binding Zn-finger/Zn-ribbon topoisomerase 1